MEKRHLFCFAIGPGKLTATVENPDGSQTDVLITDNGDDTYTITWTPMMVGKHKVTVKFGGKDIPGSPFTVNALMKVIYLIFLYILRAQKSIFLAGSKPSTFISF